MPTCSYRRYNFFLILFDDCTSHGWNVNLKHKSDANPAIQQFVAMVRTQYGKVIRQFQINARGEFKSKELTEFFKELSVNILTSIPHMHQQNGHAERFIRTIMDKSQAIRLESCAPQSWWEFSVNCAIHVYNRTSIQCHNWKTLVELLEHTKPDVTHLHVFGCSVYILPEEVCHNKLNPKSELMTFIGYPRGVKGYLFMRSLNNVLFTAIQALFDETLFLKCPDMHHPEYTPAPDQPDGEQGEYNIPPVDDENNGNGGGPPFPPMGPGGGYGNQYIPPQPLAGPAPQQSPWQAQGYLPLPPSLSNHPTPPISSGLPSPVCSRAPSPSPRHSPAPSSDYDHNWFTSKEDYQQWLRDRAAETQRVDQRRAEEALRYHNASGTEPLAFDTQGNIFLYLWNRLQQQQRVQQPDPVVLPQKGPSGSQPRCSSRTTQPVVHPDNLYENQAPTDTEQMTDTEFQRLMGGVPAPSRLRNHSKSPQTGKRKNRADYLARIEQEGGAGLIDFLLSAAIKPTDGAGGKLPDVRNVHEWHYRDLMHLPEAAWKEWKTACLEELESLRKCSVFKLTDLPKGQKTIGCRWVFNVKSDS